MAVFCSFGQLGFIRWLMLDGFVRQSKRALTGTVPVLVRVRGIFFHFLFELIAGLCDQLF